MGAVRSAYESLFVYELCAAGVVELDAIDDWIDEWHDAPAGKGDLREFLGMTKEEYELWAFRPAELAAIVSHHRSPKENVRAVG